MLLFNMKYDISTIDLPAVYVAGSFGRVYKYLYGIIILSAIITTAISDAYAFLNNTSKNKKQYNLYNILICLSSIFISLFGFSNLVNSIYPLFGILGLIQLILIIKKRV